MSTVLSDAAAREQITTDTGHTLFVNAGAGSGKTSALLDRILRLVLTDGVPLRNIAAMTFTDKAGAELRDRLRARFEEVRSEDGLDAGLVDEALADLDSAAIGTLHGFAQRLLLEHPIEARLAPQLEVLDEVGSSVASEERWSELRTELLDDDGVAGPLLLGMALGVKLDNIRSLAVLLGNDWDLIPERVLKLARGRIRRPKTAAFSTSGPSSGRSDHEVPQGRRQVARPRTSIRRGDGAAGCRPGSGRRTGCSSRDIPAHLPPRPAGELGRAD
jgi:ATP-dependent helicase/nuclease subunit A